MKTNNIFRLLIKYQRKDVCDNKLSNKDLMRISNCIDNFISPKNKEECVLWTGTLGKKSRNLRYINFYYKGKRTCLHRLLYHNYVEEIHDGDYIKYKCANRGICCNINHMRKLHYKKSDRKYKYIFKEPSPKSFMIEFD